MPEFFQTMMGRKYYESDLPRQTKAMIELSKSNDRLAEAIEEQNRLKKLELELDEEKQED